MEEQGQKLSRPLKELLRESLMSCLPCTLIPVPDIARLYIIIYSLLRQRPRAKPALSSFNVSSFKIPRTSYSSRFQERRGGSYIYLFDYSNPDNVASLKTLYRYNSW